MMSLEDIDRQQREWDERARPAQAAAAHAYGHAEHGCDDDDGYGM